MRDNNEIYQPIVGKLINQIPTRCWISQSMVVKIFYWSANFKKDFIGQPMGDKIVYC